VEREQERRIVEAIILSSSDPIAPARIAAVLPSCNPSQVRAIIDELNAEYAEQRRAFEIWEVAGGYQMRSLPEFAPYLREIQTSRPLRLSPAALETLAVIAYRQPVTRAEIEHIRGVDAGAVLRSLLDRQLARIAGHREVAGRPIVYATSRRFLEVFGLAKLGDLPALRAIEALPECEARATRRRCPHRRRRRSTSPTTTLELARSSRTEGFARAQNPRQAAVRPRECAELENAWRYASILLKSCSFRGRLDAARCPVMPVGRSLCSALALVLLAAPGAAAISGVCPTAASSSCRAPTRFRVAPPSASIRRTFRRSSPSCCRGRTAGNASTGSPIRTTVQPRRHRAAHGTARARTGDGSGSRGGAGADAGAPPTQVAALTPPAPRRVLDLALSPRDVADLDEIVALSQSVAPAAVSRFTADGERSALLQLARSSGFEQRVHAALAAQGGGPRGPVVLFRAEARTAGAVHGNLTFVQGHVAFHPDLVNPDQFGVIDGALGELAAGQRVLGYAVLPEHLDPSKRRSTSTGTTAGPPRRCRPN
jgi:segregation and condensation protein B